MSSSSLFPIWGGIEWHGATKIDVTKCFLLLMSLLGLRGIVIPEANARVIIALVRVIEVIVCRSTESASRKVIEIEVGQVEVAGVGFEREVFVPFILQGEMKLAFGSSPRECFLYLLFLWKHFNLPSRCRPS